MGRGLVVVILVTATAYGKVLPVVAVETTGTNVDTSQETTTSTRVPIGLSSAVAAATTGTTCLQFPDGTPCTAGPPYNQPDPEDCSMYYLCFGECVTHGKVQGVFFTGPP